MLPFISESFVFPSPTEKCKDYSTQIIIIVSQLMGRT